MTVSVSQTLVDQYGAGRLPNAYAVMVTPSQNCLDYVANKTSSGFNVVLTPSPAAATLAAGTFDVVIIA